MSIPKRATGPASPRCRQLHFQKHFLREKAQKHWNSSAPPKPYSQKMFYCYLRGITSKYKENWTRCMKGVFFLLTHSLRKWRLDPVNQVRRKCTCLLWEPKQGKNQRRTCLLQVTMGMLPLLMDRIQPSHLTAPWLYSCTCGRLNLVGKIGNGSANADWNIENCAMKGRDRFCRNLLKSSSSLSLF